MNLEELVLDGLNEDQREAVTSEMALTVVSAGPGTGKTHVISRRFTWLTLCRAIDPGRIVTITFTEKAALEMRLRIRKELKRLMELEGVAPEGRERIERVMGSLAVSHISTFHSFAVRLISSRASGARKQASPGHRRSTFLRQALSQLELGSLDLLEEMAESPEEDLMNRLKDQVLGIGRLPCTLDELVGFYRSDLKGAFQKLVEIRGYRDGKLSFDEGDPLQRAIADLLLLLASAWEGRKRRASLLDFEDMIREATNTIESWEDLPFSHVLVDELQDVNPSQNEMLKALRGKGCSLFAVGDPKQSIYSFRGADPGIFVELAKEAEEQGLYVSLKRSYRFSQGLGETLNRAFEGIFAQRLRELPFEPVLPQGGGDLAEPVEVWTVPPRGGQRARGIARLARDVVDRCGLKPSQVAILARNRSHLEGLKEALSDEGLKLRLEGSLTLGQSDLVVQVISALRAALVPGDELGLLSFLASSLSGRSLQEASKAFLEAKERGASVREEVLRAFEQEARLLEDIRRVSLSCGISSAVAHLEVLLLSDLSAEERAKALADLSRLKEIALEYERDKGFDPIGCLIYLEEALSPRGREEEIWLDEDESRLRAMTIHSSKGLEFEAVILLDFDEKEGPRGRLEISPTGKLSVRENLEGERVEDGAAEETSSKEAIRLLFVGATRARSKLVLVESGKGMVSLLAGQSGLEAKRQEGGISGEGAMEGWTSQLKLKDLPKVRSSPRLERASPSSLALLAFCPLAFRLRELMGVDLGFRDELSPPYKAEPGGREVGELVHLALRAWREGIGREEIKRALEESVDRRLCPLLEDELVLSILDESLSRASSDPVVRDLLLDPSSRREMPFAVWSEGIRIDGRFDLVRARGDEVVVLDYKLSKPSSEALELYEQQMRAYLLAAGLLWGEGAKRTRKGYLFFLREGELLEVPPDDGAMLKLVREAPSLLEKASKPEACPRGGSCPFKPTCPAVVQPA